MSAATSTRASSMRAFFVTDVGRKRSQNQDNGLADAESGLCLVADGMGGHRGGETASRIVVETVAEVFKGTRGSLSERLEKCLVEAHDRIYSLSEKNGSLQGMGTTTTLLGVDIANHPARAEVIHVGDSRCYFIQPGAIWQVTRDHSLVQEKVRAGLISRSQVKLDVMRNVITRSVGFESVLQVDRYGIRIQPGDLFLLCSDGLTGQLEDSEILEVIEEHRPKLDWDACAKELIRRANAHGGDDNISVGILEIT